MDTSRYLSADLLIFSSYSLAPGQSVTRQEIEQAANILADLSLNTSSNFQEGVEALRQVLHDDVATITDLVLDKRNTPITSNVLTSTAAKVINEKAQSKIKKESSLGSNAWLRMASVEQAIKVFQNGFRTRFDLWSELKDKNEKFSDKNLKLESKLASLQGVVSQQGQEIKALRAMLERAISGRKA
ncbi:hypothetical protein B0T17DRAFT_617079 [Bombardia bombarda]|uniref:Uncharacterized protein n=1 Tax=Bombardia bombarda TaxID=252184 RepID=A0AA39X0A6_9PEZI|nr:hypothetical protein B0T17DRAFT_617079 [Bombardia bombarda]